MGKFSYKSFCWSFGTTSFRTKNFNKTIEEQLILLENFWFAQNDKTWKSNSIIQATYYDYMKENNFLSGEAKNKSKDAREKTSGLVDIGLIDKNRKLTEVGEKLLNIAKSKNFKSDNLLNIDKDSFVYLKQLLKMSYQINGKTIRPFIVLIQLLLKFKYLNKDEFTYLLPLCIGENETEEIISSIYSLRKKEITIENIITDRLMNMENYREALKYFLESKDINEDIISEIGLNRKSRDYDKPYYKLYLALYNVFLDNNKRKYIKNLYEAVKEINISKLWKAYLFSTTSIKKIEENPNEYLNKNLFSNVKDEKEFRLAFFKVLHLLKAKATLLDYYDLNKRYIKITDIILFQDNEIKLDILPKHIFLNCKDELNEIMFQETKFLYKDIEIEKICSNFQLNEKIIIESINKEFKISIKTLTEALNVLNNKRYEKFNKLINNKFSDKILIDLLEKFENRRDKEIQELVTDSADIPTIFEYVLGIIWYKVSERKGKILDYMKLSLDADLLPKTHASGGEADIVYYYSKNKVYPEHTLLLEATLADKTNQRRMEMEPVSRHLGKHLIETKSLDSYCIFVTTSLNINVIADFRGRKSMKYYDPQNYNNNIDGMKIIPMSTLELKKIVNNKINYRELYKIFEDLHILDLAPHTWYKTLQEKLK